MTYTITPTSSDSADTCQLHAWDPIATLTLQGAQGSVELEQIQQYAAVHAALRDLCSDVANSTTSDSIMINNDPARTRAPLDLASGTAISMALPLVTTLGTLSAGVCYIPVHALSSSLRLTLDLASGPNAARWHKASAVAGGSTFSYTISNPRLNLEYVEVNAVAQAMIAQAVNNTYSWHATGWKVFRNVHPASQATNSFQISGRFDSVRSILMIQRLSAALESANYSSNTERVHNYLSDYQFRIGTQLCNPRAVDCTVATHPYAELRRIFSNVSTESAPTLLKLSEFMDEDGTATNTALTTPSSWLWGLEAQPFSQVEKLISGTNTLASQIWCDVNYQSAHLADVKAVTVDAAVEVDVLFTVANGQVFAGK